jgi:hypothetical protein
MPTAMAALMAKTTCSPSRACLKVHHFPGTPKSEAIPFQVSDARTLPQTYPSARTA